MRKFLNHERHACPFGEIHERGKSMNCMFVWFVYFVVEKLFLNVEVRE